MEDKMKDSLDTIECSDEEKIYSAILSGNIKMLEELLESGCPPNVKNRFGETPLLVACQIDKSFDRLTILKLLWENGARMNAKGGQLQETALHVAVKSQQVDLVDFLLQNGADVNARDKFDCTALHLLAGAKSNVDKNRIILHLLLERGANLHAQDVRRRTPVIEAVCESNEDNVRLLLEAGAQVDYVNGLGLTALFYACESQSPEMVEVLLRYGANVNFRKDHRRSTPLHFVAGGARHYSSDSSIKAQILIRAGAVIDAVDSTGSTALHVAVDALTDDTVKVLLEAGADVNVKDEYGNTPLHVLLSVEVNVSYEKTIEKLTRLLLERGAHVNERNNENETPFHLSALRGNVQIFSDLLKHGADVRALWYIEQDSLQCLRDTPACDTPETCGNSVDEAFTILNVATSLGHTELLNFLLDHEGVDKLQVSNFTGFHEISKPALYFAVKNGHYEVTKLLLDAGCGVNRKILHDSSVLHVAVSQRNSALIYLLLEYGADLKIKDVHGRTPFASAIDNGEDSWKNVIKIFISYLAKQSISDLDMEIIKSKDWMMDFLMDCVTELQKIKTDRICDKFMIHAISKKNAKSLVACLENENIVNSFFANDIKEKYPIYGDALQLRFELALERKEFFDDALTALNLLFKNTMKCLGYVSMPHGIARLILDFCSLRDLQQISIAVQ